MPCRWAGRDSILSSETGAQTRRREADGEDAESVGPAIVALVLSVTADQHKVIL
jgi:hypothetical protein